MRIFMRVSQRTPSDPGDDSDAARNAAPGMQQNVGQDECCDICGSRDLAELRCKVICRNCHTILRTCSDL